MGPIRPMSWSPAEVSAPTYRQVNFFFFFVCYFYILNILFLQASSNPPVRLTSLGSHSMTRIVRSSLEAGLITDST